MQADIKPRHLKRNYSNNHKVKASEVVAHLRAHSWKRVFSDSVEGNKYLPQSSSWWKGEIGICIVKSDWSHPFKGTLSLNACAAFYASVWRLTGGLLSRRVGGHLWTRWREKKGNLGLSKWYRTDVLHLTVKFRRHVYWMQVNHMNTIVTGHVVIKRL